MVYKFKNFHGKPPTGINNGDVFENCNFLLRVLTDICVGVSGLSVKSSNCHNCNFPSDTIFLGTNNTSKRDYCYNKYLEEYDGENLMELPEEEKKCRHVVDGPFELFVDGVLVGVTYKYEDIIL